MEQTVFETPIKGDSAVYRLREVVRQFASELELSQKKQAGISGAVSEIVRGILAEAGEGMARVIFRDDNDSQWVEIKLSGNQPDWIEALEVDKIRKISDELGIETNSEGHPRVTMLVELGEEAPWFDEETIEAFSRKLDLPEPESSDQSENTAPVSGTGDGTSEAEKLRAELDNTSRGVLALYQELADKNKQLEEARREAEKANQAKSDFLAKMSHELRTPLTTILGYQDLLMDEVKNRDLEDAFGDDLRMIRSSAEHLLDLINDILDLSKIASGKMEIQPETFSLDEFLDDIRQLIQPMMDENGNEFLINKDDSLDEIHTDRTKLKQCLLNLLSNAGKYTENGKIELSLTPAELNEEPAIRFEVRDTGIGMDLEAKEELFEAFEQIENSPSSDVKGTGLGLAITKKFTEMFGGKIDFESEPGVGTTFWIVIPRQPDAGVPDEDDELDSDGDRPTVLAIDDDPEDLEKIRSAIEPEGYHVVTEDASKKALERAHEEDPDVITLDVIMSEIDGWNVLQQLKEDDDLRDVPVVMLTVTNDEELGQSLGAQDFLSKPVDKQRLLATIDEHGQENRNETVLIIDDQKPVRDRLRRILEQEDFRIREARNGEEALEKLQEQFPDVVLLDLLMPKVDGFEVLQQLHQDDGLPEVPVIVLTNKSLDPDEKKQLTKQAQVVLKKGDNSRKQLLSELDRLKRDET